MNSRLTTILTLSGVLVAGTAAAAVNSNILSNRSPLSTPSAAAGASTARSASASRPSAGTTDDAATDVTEASEATEPSSTDVTEVDPTEPTDPHVEHEVTYEVGDAGSIRLHSDGEELSIVSAMPAPGWTIASTSAEDERITVVLNAPLASVTFTASMVHGVVVTSVESTPLSLTPNAEVPSGADGSSSGDAPSPSPSSSTPTVTRPRRTTPRTTAHVEDHEDDHASETTESHDD